MSRFGRPRAPAQDELALQLRNVKPVAQALQEKHGLAPLQAWSQAAPRLTWQFLRTRPCGFVAEQNLPLWERGK